MKYLIPVLYLLIFSACNYGEQSAPQSNMKDGMEMEASRAEQPPAPPEQPDATDIGKAAVDKSQKIIKDGYATIEVTNLQQAKAHIDTILGNYKAYYENKSFESSYYQSSYQLKIRVPAAQFEALLAGIEQGGGKVTNKNVTARDVTEEYIDLTTRLDNNRAYLKRYNELLQKANTIKDILDIQEKTRIIESDIESMEGRLRYLNDLVNYSTLNLTLVERKEYQASDDRDFGKQLRRAFKGGVNGFLDFLLLLVNLWPFLILLPVIIWAFRRWRTARKD